MSYIAFPHQYSDLLKLRRILQTISVLLSRGHQPLDDVLGYELLSSGIIGARKFAHLPIAQQIQAWQQLAPSLQTPRTTARDLRRTFKIFGLLEELPTGNFRLTERGERVACASESVLSDEETQVWTNALLNLKFYSAADDPGINAGFRTRPFILMLHLLEHQALENRLLAFAMAANSEDPSEIQRIKAIVDGVTSGGTTLDQALQAEIIPRAQAADLVKILPSMGEQLGLIDRRAGVSSLTDRGRVLLTNARSQAPIWYRDLPEDGTRCERMAAVLATLSQGDVEEQALLQVLVGIGSSLPEVMADLSTVGIQVAIVSGFVSATPAISFDLLQDVPSAIRNGATFGAFSDLLRIGMCSAPTVVLPPTGPLVSTTRPRPVIRRRRFRGSRQITNPATLIPSPGAPVTALPAVDPLERARQIELQRERTEQHQRLVAAMSELYLARGITPIEKDFDLLIETNGIAVLHEMKTLTDTNERLQVMHAVGQLLYYEYFDVPLEIGLGVRLEKAVVFDRALADRAHMDYLESLGIHVFWTTSAGEIDGTPSGIAFLRNLLSL